MDRCGDSRLQNKPHSNLASSTSKHVTPCVKRSRTSFPLPPWLAQRLDPPWYAYKLGKMGSNWPAGASACAELYAKNRWSDCVGMVTCLIATNTVDLPLRVTGSGILFWPVLAPMVCFQRLRGSSLRLSCASVRVASWTLRPFICTFYFAYLCTMCISVCADVHVYECVYMHVYMFTCLYVSMCACVQRLTNLHTPWVQVQVRWRKQNKKVSSRRQMPVE